MRTFTLLLLLAFLLAAAVGPTIVSAQADSWRTPAPGQPGGDTLWHYFDDGRVSAFVSARVEGREQIRAFNRRGDVIFQAENYFSTFSVSHQLTFYPDGGLWKVHGRSTPDAGIYEYHSYYTFCPDQRLAIEHHEETGPGGIPTRVHVHIPGQEEQQDYRYRYKVHVPDCAE